VATAAALMIDDDDDDYPRDDRDTPTDEERMARFLEDPRVAELYDTVNDSGNAEALSSLIGMMAMLVMLSLSPDREPLLERSHLLYHRMMQNVCG
jgi:hypothetical protein